MKDVLLPNHTARVYCRVSQRGRRCRRSTRAGERDYDQSRCLRWRDKTGDGADVAPAAKHYLQNQKASFIFLPADTAGARVVG